ncbi:hypothetical protein AB0J86_15460 [Micromonospora sp. NPDC049559]|uniref:hypothetical protein n=1 Tax=Micromonospora sp. NPDC049559 TaxID=3155923 RepID=UPI003431DDA9
MAIPTDRGVVALTKDDSGRTAVMIGTGVHEGEIQGVFAMHVGPGRIVVDPQVPLKAGAAGQFTTEAVDVHVGSDGAVYVKKIDATGDLRTLQRST